jgi:hypothetical protein
LSSSSFLAAQPSYWGLVIITLETSSNTQGTAT